MVPKLVFAIFVSGLLFLQGCLPVVFVAGAAAGSVVYDHRPAKVIVYDKEIAFRVQDRLSSRFKDSNLSVAAFNGIVLLVGQTPSEEVRLRAEEIARSHSRVRMVYNEITVGSLVSGLDRTTDAWITTKVKATLAAAPGLNSTSLKVVTENRVVYLMGLTTPNQGKLAAAKARRVSRVEKVVKLFEYEN